jgi:hypothetical protein
MFNKKGVGIHLQNFCARMTHGAFTLRGGSKRPAEWFPVAEICEGMRVAEF